MPYPYKYPYSDMYTLNLDWIIDTINNLKTEIEDSGVQTVNGLHGNVVITGENANIAANVEMPIKEYIDRNIAGDESGWKAGDAELQENIDSIWNYAIGDMDNLGAATLVEAVGNISTLTVGNTEDLVNAVNLAYSLVVALDRRVGVLANLQTADKTTIVAAINEVLSTAAAAATMVGVLQLLTTTDKSSVVAAINEVRTDALSGISTATASINTLATRVSTLETVSATKSSVQSLAANIGTMEDLRTTVKDSLVLAINEVLSKIATTDGKVGNLADLNTSVKSSIVNAVNEVLQYAGTVNSRVGDLTALSTTNKTSVVAALNEIAANLDVSGSLTFTVPVTATGTSTYTVNGLTEFFALASYQFFDGSQTAVAPFADITLTSNTNSLTVNVTSVAGTGTVRLSYINSTSITV